MNFLINTFLHKQTIIFMSGYMSGLLTPVFVLLYKCPKGLISYK